MRNMLLFRKSWLLIALIFIPALGFAQINEKWVARFNGTGNSRDGVRAAVVDPSGNVYVKGNSSGSGVNFDYATIKYNTAGVQQWAARYNGPGNEDFIVRLQLLFYKFCALRNVTLNTVIYVYQVYPVLYSWHQREINNV